MHAIFIADAHLKKPEDNNYRIMLRFLEGLPGKTDMLVIAGDFFEFWLGDSPLPFPHYRKVLETLETVTASGVKLVFIEGNHDFHLKRYFQRVFAADVFPESAALTLDEKRIFICHGDSINQADYGYRALRLLFRNPFTRLLTRVIPSSVPALIAEKLGNHSKGKHAATASKWDGKQLARIFAANRFANGYDVVVTAHYHDPFMEQSGEKILLSLGDWITQFSYGEWIDGELTLKTYLPDNS
jgi:UDP-2,3-diacylglucosamine hydrolase